MGKLLIASNNPKKIKEIKDILGGFFLDFLTFKDFNIESPEEDGSSFEENSLIKARHGCLLTGLPTLADDSGLCVEHLGGEPGIYSSRYSSEGDDVKNYQKLLDNLKGVEQRAAYFISVIALVYPDGQEIVTEGKVHGVISNHPRGDNGFGYDPIFYLPQYGSTIAEISKEEKNKISHRGVALQNLKAKLEGKG